jgi:hypothetical protein
MLPSVYMEHLLVHPLLAGLTDIGAADIEVPMAGDCQLIVSWDRPGWGFSCRSADTDECQHKQPGNGQEFIGHGPSSLQLIGVCRVLFDASSQVEVLQK